MTPEPTEARLPQADASSYETKKGAWLIGWLLIAPLAAFLSLLAWLLTSTDLWSLWLIAAMAAGGSSAALLSHRRRGSTATVVATGVVTGAATFAWFWVELFALFISWGGGG